VGSQAVDGPALQEHPAAVGLVEAADDVEQGALARAVGADEAEDGAPGHGEGDSLEGLQAAEGLLDLVNFQERPAAFGHPASPALAGRVRGGSGRSPLGRKIMSSSRMTLKMACWPDPTRWGGRPM